MSILRIWDDVLKKYVPVLAIKGEPGSTPVKGVDYFTDAEKASFFLSVYPVGSVYLSFGETSPALLFGGTWERIRDRFLYGAGGTDAVNSVGGEREHTLSIAEMPSHGHEVKSNNRYIYGDYTGTGGSASLRGASTGKYESTAYAYAAAATGGSQPHNNMPPYICVNMWQRIA